jgi:hypothetical protein
MTKTIALFLILFCSAFAQLSRATEVATEVDQHTVLLLVKLSTSALSVISSDWSPNSAKKVINPIGYRASSATYEAMLSRDSYLGKFKSCTDMNYGKPDNLDVKGATALLGTCDFEHGSAKVMIVFLQLDGKMQIMSLLIGKQ